MKKLEIVIQPEKLEDLKGILDDCQANGLMITNIMGYGNQKGHKKIYRGAEYSVNLLPKVKVETIVEPDTAEKIIKRVVDEIQTGYLWRWKNLCIRSTGCSSNPNRRTWIECIIIRCKP